tara:strand:- start:2763 stop:3293 length:531 start_codon:yes stop_codon:yes gene_type:complete
MGYCSTTDVSIRLGLDSAQKARAATRITSAIQRASINIDQEFRDYGRDAPQASIVSTTLDGSVAVGATSITLTSGTGFSTAGTGSVGGDSFKWTGKTTDVLSGVTGISFSHATGETVEEGEFAAIIREVCADLASSIYLEDEAAFHQAGADPVRSNILRMRGTGELRRLAHLGTVD